ncbi:MAG TPA: GAF domain-containing sensor histidine kinase [Candidatus Limnocylindrales bacterium]|nr:GAF domain-containing sensor histidine kinase [Candidatus Limnocylindrales bacterium]
MVETQSTRGTLLPMHRLIADLEAWRAEPTPGRRDMVEQAVGELVRAYSVRSIHLTVQSPAMPTLEVAIGTQPVPSAPEGSFALDGAPDAVVRLRIDADPLNREALKGALLVAFDGVVSRQEARFQRQQLEALDAAVRGIADVLSVDLVLQLIVDRVRELVGAEYAALGIVGQFGNIEQFVTSGLSDEVRARIGPLPRGHGLLGLIIREDSSFLIDDIAADHRRHGFPPDHPEMHSFLGVPVRSKKLSIGNLYLTNKISAATFNESDLRLVEMFALHAGIAMENARLHEEVQRLAIVDERQRISQDLHDSIIQSLYAISLSLEDLPEIFAEDPAEGAARADRAIDSIHATTRDIRNFIFGLQPELLEDSDLRTGLATLATEFRTNALIDLEVVIPTHLPALPDEHAAHVLAISREALSNVVKHSSASRAALEVAVRDGQMRLTVSDNGRGFDAVAPRSLHQRGLANLRARAEAVGGTLAVTSSAISGTRIEAEIPL